MIFFQKNKDEEILQGWNGFTGENRMKNFDMDQVMEGIIGIIMNEEFFQG